MIVYSAFNGYSGGHLALDEADRKVTRCTSVKLINTVMQ